MANVVAQFCCFNSSCFFFFFVVSLSHIAVLVFCSLNTSYCFSSHFFPYFVYSQLTRETAAMAKTINVNVNVSIILFESIKPFLTRFCV